MHATTTRTRCMSALLGWLVCLIAATTPAAVRDRRSAGHQYPDADVITRRIINPSDVNSLREFNITLADLNAQWARVKGQRSTDITTAQTENAHAMLRLDTIQTEILQRVATNVTVSTPQPELANEDSVQHDMIYYPICSRHSESADRFGANTSKMYFSTMLFGRLHVNSRIDSAVLRIYQKPHGRATINCSDPIERVFFTVSVLVRRNINGEVHMARRDCDTVSRTINNSGWIELDIAEVMRHWLKTRKHLGGSVRSTDPMLMIDVHDQDRNELNASQYFEGMDCQASNTRTGIPWRVFAESAANLSEFDLPHYPRLDLTIRESYGSDRIDMRRSYLGRSNRLEQLFMGRVQPPADRETNDEDGGAVESPVHRRNGRHSGGRRQRDHHHQRKHRQRQSMSSESMPMATVAESTQPDR